MKCAVKNVNTNEGRCRFDWGLFQRIILIPVDEEYSGVGDFNDWLMAGIHAADPDLRYYPMPQFSGAEDTSEDNTTSTNGYGKTYVVREGNKGITQKYNPNYCLTNRLSAFNDGVARGALILDSRGNVWGCKGANGGMKGFTTELFCSAARPTPADSIQEPSIAYTFTKPEEFSNKMVEETDLTVNAIQGLEDIEMVKTVSGSDTLFNFLTVCDGKDVTSEMQAIGGEESAWMGIAKQQDNSVVKSAFTTAPSYDSTNKTFKLATASLPSGATAATLADAAVLYGLGVSYKECVNEVSLS